MAEYTVYIYRDAEQRALYVGITKRGHARAEEHAASKWWWRLVADASFIHVASEEAALDIERTLIQAIYPIANIQHSKLPEDGRVPQLSNGQVQNLVQGRSVRFTMRPISSAARLAARNPELQVTVDEAEIRALPLPQRIGRWIEMPYEEKMALGCVECWRTPRIPQWSGARCPECKAANPRTSRAVAKSVDRPARLQGTIVSDGTARARIASTEAPPKRAPESA